MSRPEFLIWFIAAVSSLPRTSGTVMVWPQVKAFMVMTAEAIARPRNTRTIRSI